MRRPKLLFMPQRQLITVVIDSTAIWNDWHLDRKAWDVLQVFVEHGLLQVCVPEVVVQEVSRGYKRATNDLLGELKKLELWKLHKLLGLSVPTNIKDLKPSVDQRISDYEPILRRRFDERRVAVVPLPQVEHQVLLTRALENRKPFDAEGKNGFRDALIWHTVLDLCYKTARTTKVLFITDNTNDFCDKKSGGLLAPLQAEVEAAGSVPVTTVRDLAAAVEYPQQTEQLDAEVAPHGLPVVDPSRELIIEAVTQGCNGLSGQETGTADADDRWSDDPDFSGFRTVIEGAATLQDLQPDFSTLDWSIEGRDSDGRPVIEVSVTAQFLLEGMAFKADYWGENDLSIEVYDDDWNNHYMWIATHHTGRLSFTIYLTPDSSDVDETEFVEAAEILPEPPA